MTKSRKPLSGGDTVHAQYRAVEEAVKRARQLGYSDYSFDMRRITLDAMEKAKIKQRQ